MDERPDQFEGFAYLYDNDPEMPGTFAPILTGNKANPANFIVHLHALDQRTEEPRTWASLAELYPGVQFAQTAVVSCEWSDELLNLTWKTNLEHG